MHPQTLFDAPGLAALQAAATGTHAALAANLKDYVAANNTVSAPDVDPEIEAAHAAAFPAITRLLGDRPTDVTAARAIVDHHFDRQWSGDRDLDQARDLAAGAIGYDVFFDLLQPAKQASYKAKIAASAADLAAATAGEWWTTDLVQNHNWVNFAALGLAGQALDGENLDPQPQNWRDMAAANFAKVKIVQDLVVDGSWHEGIGYLEFGLSNAIAYWLGAVRGGSNDDKTELLRRVGRYILYAQLPNQPRVHVMTHADWNWSRPGLIAVLRWAARRFTDGYAAQAARRWDLQPRLTRKEFGLNYVLEYVAYDPGVAPVDTGTVPLDVYNQDQQSVILRSSWDFGSVQPKSDPILVGFKAGVFGGRGNYERMRTCAAPGGSLNFSHDHEDDLGLWIYGKGGWLLPEAVAYNCCYTDTPDYQSTPWHNTFLFDGTGQLGDTKTLVLPPQRPHPETSKGCGTNTPAWFYDREASMPLHASTDHYAFAGADGTKLYPSTLGVTTLFRTVGLCRELGGFIVLQDRALLTRPRTVEQLFHSMEPNGTDDTGHPWIRLTNRNASVLGIRVVAPATYSAQVTTQMSNNYQEDMDDDGKFGLVRVATTTPTSNVIFLEVLWPQGSAGWAKRPAVAPLDAGRPHRGFSMPAGASQESWIYNTAGTSTVAGNLVIEGNGPGVVGVRRTGAGGSPERLVVLGGGRLADQNGVTLLDLGGNAGVLEVEFAGTRATLSGTASPVGVTFRGVGVTDVEHASTTMKWTRNGDLITVTGL